MADRLSLLVPRPQRLETSDDGWTLSKNSLLYLASAPATIRPIAYYLERLLSNRGLNATLTATAAGGKEITLQMDRALLRKPESYRIVVDRLGITITGADEAGLFYGVCTLGQLLRLYGQEAGPIELPAVRITDWPDFAQRGVMLDVTRDKVPTMATMYQLVDLLAGLKINQLQLYTEHTFAYQGHEVVWEKASPFTGEEILALDAYCRERHVELVPNQNSFGHMHRWLKHEPYRHLAELPEGFNHPFSAEKEPYSLCPIDPGSLDLLTDLYDQLLPHFSSTQFNVGLDETFDLGLGRSQAACQEKGQERVYLDFLLDIYREVKRRGHTMQFWGDIILHQPDLIAELPKDVIALEWGYDAAHPFAEHGELFAGAGLSFYVCPGTSSWNTLAGRTDNALGNLRNAAVNGKANGAIGYLITDWGDFGHMQPLPVSYLGYLAGAAYSWNVGDAQAPERLDIPALLDTHVFRDSAGVMGQLAYDLGNVYQEPGVTVHNSSVLFWQFIFPEAIVEPEAEEPPDRVARFRRRIKESLAEADFADTLAYIDRVMAPLSQAKMAQPDADWIEEEFAWVADMLRFAARLGTVRSAAGLDKAVSALPSQEREALAESLRTLIDRHREVWLRRSRPGGLADSVHWLERMLAALEA